MADYLRGSLLRTKVMEWMVREEYEWEQFKTLKFLLHPYSLPVYHEFSGYTPDEKEDRLVKGASCQLQNAMRG